MIRSLRPTDLFSILAPGNSFSDYVRTGNHLGWDGDSGSILPSLMGQFNYIKKPHHSWVWIEKNKIQGLLFIQQRGGHSAWEINSLLLSSEGENVSFKLLDGLGLVSGPLMITRFFVRLPADSKLMEMVRKSGFSAYAWQRLYRRGQRECSPGAPGWIGGDTAIKFPLHRPGQDFKLFQIYNQLTPEAIRCVEGLTFEDWKESRECVPGETIYLCEKEGKTLGWVCVKKRAGKGWVEVMGPQDDGNILKGSFSWGLSRLATQREIYYLAFSYQTGLCQLLENHGFRVYREYCLLAREQVVRVKQPYLVPARL